MCRLGGFHTIMSFLGSIGKMMAGTGLSDLLETIYGENAVKHMMTGKAVSRALRGHFLIESVLTKKILKILLPDAWVAEPTEADLERGNEDKERQDAWIGESMEVDLVGGNNNEERQLIETKREVTKETEEIEELLASFIDGEVTIDDVSGSEAVQNLEICLQRCKDYLSSKSRTSKLWIQYLEYISILKLFIYAERTGNWNLHLLANSQMLNLFSATGHWNYAKSSRLYLQLMLELPFSFPDIHEKFTNDGFHTIRRSDRFWGGLWSDVIIEQVMMHSLKSRGGLTRGRGVTETVRLTWIYSMHGAASVHNSMTELTNARHRTSEQHIELGKSGMKRDKDDSLKLQEWLEVYDPLDRKDASLRNVYTGVTARITDKINCDDVEKVGKGIHETLDNKAFIQSSLKRKAQITTLESLNVGVNIEKEKVYVDPSILFSRLLVIMEREDDVKKYFAYELTLIPTSLFQDGMMRKATKSMLANFITRNIHSVQNYLFPVYIIDGGALLHKVKWSINNADVQQILDQYSSYLRGKYGICCVVFDGYESGPSIKDHEHKRRSGKKAANLKIQTNTKMTCSQELFLKNDANKTQLIDLLTTQLIRDDIEVRRSSGDVDTLIVSAALEYARNERKVIVKASDTDILVLLIFHWEAGMKITMSPDTNIKGEEKQWNIEDIVNDVGEAVSKHILFMHAWTRCDTTSIY